MTTLGWFLFFIAPFFFSGVLWFRKPSIRRVRPGILLGYLAFLAVLLTSALLFVAWVAGARLHWREVAIALWFTVIWRLLWELWKSTVGVWGQRWVRWSRRRRRASPPVPLAVRLIPAGRIFLTAAIFFPAMLSCVATHRVKLADGHNPETVFNMAFESLRIPTSDGLTLDAWWIPRPQARRTILIAHGAGANKGNFIWFLGGLAHDEFNVLLFDFRAHGASDGRVTTWGIQERKDVLAVVEWLKRERPQEARQIIGVGSSQGAMALALAAAEEPRIDAVILDSPFVSARELAHYHAGIVPVAGPLMVDWVLLLMSLQVEGDFFTYSAEQAVAALGDRPVLVIHGEKDFAMPAEHARRLYNAATGPRAVWFGPGGHSNIVTADPQGYADQVFAFLAVNGLVNDE